MAIDQISALRLFNIQSSVLSPQSPSALVYVSSVHSCLNVGISERVASKNRFTWNLFFFIKPEIYKSQALIYCNMKAHMEEVEDDLAAEEENKLINEVWRVFSILPYCIEV